MKKLKKSILVLAINFLEASVASAKTVREDAGCGLGGVAIGEKEGLSWDLLGTFLNSLSGNQTFGMSSGTLDCDPSAKKIAKNDQLKIYVADNIDGLAVDIAAGQGETLEALAEIANIPAEKQDRFFAHLQDNFDYIYPSAQVSHDTIVERIINITENI